MEHRRKQRRFVRRCNTDFIVGGVTHKGVASNFSLTGLFIRTNSPYAEGTVIDVVIHCPDGSISRVMGKVVRAAKTQNGKVMGGPMKTVAANGMGIEIIGKDANYLHLIRALLS